MTLWHPPASILDSFVIMCSRVRRSIVIVDLVRGSRDRNSVNIHRRLRYLKVDLKLHFLNHSEIFLDHLLPTYLTEVLGPLDCWRLSQILTTSTPTGIADALSTCMLAHMPRSGGAVRMTAFYSW